MLGKTLLPGDEELGKKDDDHRFLPVRRSAWSGWNHTFRWRRRRNVLLAIAALLLWFLYRSTGATLSVGELGGASEYADLDFRPRKPHTPSIVAFEKPAHDKDEPNGAPPGMVKPQAGEAVPHTYDGKVRFFRLAPSLRSASLQTAGEDEKNRNILFAMSSLQSAARLIPMLCEMSMGKDVHVHAALMGREDMGLEDLLELNGVNEEHCTAIWHDARADYSEYSSDRRAEGVVTGAMGHINTFLHPQAVITDDSQSEDAFFVRGMRSKTSLLKMPLIEVPKDRLADLMWLTRLDARSLKHWHTPKLDILIQVPPASSSVLRLLKSLEDADYSGLTPPRIILELPANLDASVKRRLEKFEWPPHKDADSPSAPRGLIIRRRITKLYSTQEDAAIRFLELFYPHNDDSHVLLLSPQAQLSSQYLHYVKYTLLKYQYSTYEQGGSTDTTLMGISLHLPTTLLDGQSPLTRPGLGDMHTERYMRRFPNVKKVPFLWQAPESHATLFFGEKWAAWYDFLGNRVLKHQSDAKAKARKKEVSETMPSWAEYMLEFMRARGYAILYPATTSQALVTVHNELYHAPDEYTPHPKEESTEPPSDVQEPFLKGDTQPPAPSYQEPPSLAPSTPLLDALPFSGELPEILDLPYLLHTGQHLVHDQVYKTAEDYANVFRAEVGGCPKLKEGKKPNVFLGKSADLFCFGDEEEEDWEQSEDELGELKEELDGLMAEEAGLHSTSATVSSSTSTRMPDVGKATGPAVADVY
ncbi:hypothetical protein IAQ61_003504 [Plenodomus lingam]|uniref:uncharacterized protein n=1 Tax=Leptosphaeria maculans TaxID=5022 RepID=UPI0033205BE9|nr:hypothetical protein IAQ61_003504 [Plenodomus lingam]